MLLYSENNYSDLYNLLILDCLSKQLNLFNTQIVLTNILNNTFCNQILQKDFKHLSGKLYWHISKSKYVHELIPYNLYYILASNNSLDLNSAYGYKLFSIFNEDNLTQFEFCLSMLKSDSTTNSALFFINDSTLMIKNNKDKPCLLSGQFVIHDNKLNLITTYSSIDLFEQLTFDISFLSILMQLMYLNLYEDYSELILGDLIINSSKVFILKKDKELFTESLKYEFIQYKLPYLYNCFIRKDITTIEKDPLIKFILENK